MEKGNFPHSLSSPPQKQSKQVKHAFPTDNSILSVSKVHSPGRFTAISSCHGIKFRKPHFQVHGMTHSQLPLGMV